MKTKPKTPKLKPKSFAQNWIEYLQMKERDYMESECYCHKLKKLSFVPCHVCMGLDSRAKPIKKGKK